MRALSVFIISFILTACGLGLFYYKHHHLEFPLTPNKKYNSWYIEAKFEMKSNNPYMGLVKQDTPVWLRFKLPKETPNIAIVDEDLIGKNFGKEITKDEFGNRVAEFTKRNITGREMVFYRAITYQLESPSEPDNVAPPVANSPYSSSNRLVTKDDKDAPFYEAIDALIGEAKSRSSGKKSFVKEIAKILKEKDNSHVSLLVDRFGADKKDRVALAAMLIEAAGIPVNLVHGAELENEQMNANFKTWLDVYVNKKWQSFDFDTGSFNIPQTYIPWWYGDSKTFYEVEGAESTKVKVSVRKNTDNSLTRAIWKSGEVSNFLLKFSFFNLPIDSQIVFKTLLMIPVGGLVIAFLRQVIGLKTFGTFMPILVAISFKETGLMSGLIFFTFIVIIGLFIRSYFHHLQLLLVPRLAAVLTIVVLIISIVAMAAHNFEFNFGLSVALFPIVILTMTIERMTISWEESGPSEAIKSGVGSLVAASAGYLVISDEIVQHLFFTFPELLLVNLAMAMCLGRYNGYKLTEYYRFKKLNRDMQSRKIAAENDSERK